MSPTVSPVRCRPNWSAGFLLLPSLLFAQTPPKTEEMIHLDPFEIRANENESYVVEEAQTGTIIAVPREKIPFSMSVVTSEMIRDFGIDNAADISEYLTGVSRSTNPLIGDESGYTSLNFRVRGFVSQPLYNGFQTGGRVFSSDNLGRVEASKGPNAVLYGQAPAGGVINFIPKAPRFTDHASFSGGGGSNAYSKFAFDAGSPLKLTRLPGEAAFRIGGSLLSFEREQIFFKSDTASAFGAFTWRLNNRLSFESRAEYTKLDVVPSRTPAFVSLGSGPARVVDPFNRLRRDRNFSYNGPYSHNTFSNYLTTLHGTLYLKDNVILRIGGFASERWRDVFLLDGTFGLGTAQRVTGAKYNKVDDHSKTTAMNGDLLWQAKLGNWSFDTLLGYAAHWERGHNQSIATPSNIVVDIPFSRRPLASDYQAPPPLSSFSVLQDLSKGSLEWINVRFTQFIKSPGERATVMWGLARGDGSTIATNLRLGQSSRSEGKKTTYTIGATMSVYNRADAGALDKVILFGNTSTSFNIQGGNSQDPSKFQGFTTVEALRAFANTVAPNAISPQEGDGYEFGFRTQWLGGKLGFTALYFDQNNQNIARNFFVRESNVAGVNSETVIQTFQLAGGKENSHGYEFSLDWHPTPQFTFTGSAQITKGRVKENPEAPEEVGFGLVQSPEDMYSFMARYNFAAHSPLSGLSLGLGLSHNSPTRIRPEIGDRFRISDAYTNVRAFVNYTFKTDRASHTLSFNVENLLNEEYTQEENFLSEPRLYRLSYRLDF